MLLTFLASIELRNRFGFMVFSTVVMFLVRPHMAGHIANSTFFTILFDKNVKFVGKAALLLLAFIVACMIAPLTIKYAGLNELGQIVQYIEKRQGYNQGSGSSLNVSGMS